MSKSREKTISELLDSLHLTLPFFDQPEALLKKRYAPGKWTVREILIHLSDTETVHLDRLRRLASEDNPVLLNFDQDKWARELFYGKRDLNIARQQYEAARRNVIELARSLKTSVDKRTGIHNIAGPRTFGWVLEHIAEHNHHHLKQARAAIDGRRWKAK